MISDLHTEYRRRCKTKSDIHWHLPKLRELASECTVVAEYGVRTGNSTVALLDGLPENGTLHSYDLNTPALEFALPPLKHWVFHKANTRHVSLLMKNVDGLFIDSWHAAEQVATELENSAPNVGKWIAFHDVQTFGTRDEKNAGPGLFSGIFNWWQLERNQSNWVPAYFTPLNNGLLVLRRV